MGLLGIQSSPPDWLISHFEASIANLATYKTSSMDLLEAPKTLIIWARDGLCKDTKDQKFPRSAGEAKSVEFLLDNRLDLRSNGWNKLLGEGNIITMTVQGNHFTMTREPDVSVYHQTLGLKNSDTFDVGATSSSFVTAWSWNEIVLLGYYSDFKADHR